MPHVLCGQEPEVMLWSERGCWERGPFGDPHVPVALEALTSLRAGKREKLRHIEQIYTFSNVTGCISHQLFPLFMLESSRKPLVFFFFSFFAQQKAVNFVLKR